MVDGVRWQLNPQNKEVLYNMVKTLIQGKKGIYLLGDHGSGKTEMMNAIITVNNQIQHHYDNLKHIYRHHYDVIYDDIRITGHAKIIQNMVKNIYIDDFLYQNRAAAKVFGNNDNVADLVITRCYELHKAGHRIYMTSNYGIKYMTENNYIHKGSADRIREMVEVYRWEGESMR
jgi:DNA replication protein DnaC